MICLVTVLDTLTHPYSMLYPTPSPSLCPWVKFCTHSQRGLGWCLCASYIWMVPCRDSAVTIYRIDQVVLMLWLLLHSQSYWPCSSGVVSFAETVEAPANGNQVKIWKFSYSRLSTESVFTAYLNDIVVLICDIVNHCFLKFVSRNLRTPLFTHIKVSLRVLGSTTASLASLFLAPEGAA